MPIIEAGDGGRIANALHQVSERCLCFRVNSRKQDEELRRSAFLYPAEPLEKGAEMVVLEASLYTTANTEDDAGDEHSPKEGSERLIPLKLRVVEIAQHHGGAASVLSVNVIHKLVFPLCAVL